MIPIYPLLVEEFPGYGYSHYQYIRLGSLFYNTQGLFFVQFPCHRGIPLSYDIGYLVLRFAQSFLVTV